MQLCIGVEMQLCIGRDGGAGVTEDYPGTEPWPFTGGTIRRVAVDVSGEAYIDSNARQPQCSRVSELSNAHASRR